MDNREIARIFEEIADLLEIKNENPFRIRAHRRVAETIASLPFDVTRAILDEPEKIRSLPGIGEATVKKIQELVETGECQEHRDLTLEVPPSLLDLLQLQNLGPKKIALFWEKLNITNLDELEGAARAGALKALPGMGEKSESKLLKAIDEFRARAGRFRLDVGTECSRNLVRFLEDNANITRIAAAGSLRRRKETVGDIDILVSTDEPGDAMGAFVAYPDVKEVLARGDTKASVRLRNGFQADLRVLEDGSFGAALQYFSGSKEHNVALRERAKRMGFKISEYGLFETESGTRIAGANEEEIYRALGLDFIPPEMRENRGEIELAETSSLPALIRESDIKGDLHTHTHASDGRDSIEEMATAARQKGYQYLAITDHSKALAMTGGLDEKRLLQQMAEIERIRTDSPGIEILKGIEVDILGDGALDLSDEVLGQLDVVIASIHSRFGMSRKEMTLRVCRALENPVVNILAHPTGRLIMKREPFEIDLEEVMRTAVRERVCLEINSYPDRLDLNDINCKMARDMGALVSINTDSHSTEMLRLMSYGVDTARRGWLEVGDVVNTYSVERLRKVLSKELYR